MPHPWDADNEEEQCVVLTSPKYKDLLNKKRADLTEVVNPSPLWVYLRQLNIIDRLEEETLRHNAIQTEIVARLLNHLERNPSWKLHGFLLACALTGQQHVITLLGLVPSRYDVPEAPTSNYPGLTIKKRHIYQSREKGGKEIPSEIMNAILQHCESYRRNLMQTTLFGFKNSKLIDLTQLYIYADTKWTAYDREIKKLTKRKLFQRGEFAMMAPRSIQFEGPPGAGKTTYLREYAHSWSSELIACHERGPLVRCQGHKWKFLVYIPAGSIKGSAEEAIRENLKCDQSLRDQTMAWIQEDGDGVLIIHDAVDELHDEYSKQSLCAYAKSCKEIRTQPKLLISTRNALCFIPPLCFDRVVNTDGFTLEQGVEFVQKFFNEQYGITDHSILKYIQLHSKDLEVILCNPLRALVFSELTAKGSLTLHDVKTLNPIKLLKCLEGHIVRRENENHALTPSTAQSEQFYQLCLQALLKNQRQFSEDQVDQGSPYQAFLIRKMDINEDGQDIASYEFPHEMIFEYFSVRGLIQDLEDNIKQKDIILLHLCTNQNMRNILQFTSAFICQYKPELFDNLVSLIRACLILQCETEHRSNDECIQNLLQLPNEIKQMNLAEVLQRELTDEESDKITEIWRKINRAFNEDAEKLKESGWFRNLHHTSGEELRSNFLPFITQCQQQGTPEEHEKLCSQTTHRILPCLWSQRSTGYQEFGIQYKVLPMEGTRWVVSRSCSRTVTATQFNNHNGNQYHVEITAWCPTDATEVIAQISEKDRLRLSHVLVNLDYSDQWGPCPNSLMSTSACDSLTEHFHSENLLDIMIYTVPGKCLRGMSDSLAKAFIGKAKATDIAGKTIRVWGGEMEYTQAQDWQDLGHQQGFKLNLCFVTIVGVKPSGYFPIKETRTLGLYKVRYVTWDGIEVTVRIYRRTPLLVAPDGFEMVRGTERKEKIVEEEFEMVDIKDEGIAQGEQETSSSGCLLQ